MILYIISLARHKLVSSVVRQRHFVFLKTSLDLILPVEWFHYFYEMAISEKKLPKRQALHANCLRLPIKANLAMIFKI